VVERLQADADVLVSHECLSWIELSPRVDY